MSNGFWALQLMEATFCITAQVQGTKANEHKQKLTMWPHLEYNNVPKQSSTSVLQLCFLTCLHLQLYPVYTQHSA